MSPRDYEVNIVIYVSVECVGRKFEEKRLT